MNTLVRICQPRRIRRKPTQAARPEWYFLFLFEGLKYFNKENLGETFGNEFYGAIVAPGVVMGFLFLMPLIGKWKLGHGFNVAMVIAMLFGAGLLTAKALQTDYYANIYSSIDDSADEEAKQLHATRTENSLAYIAATKSAAADAHRLREVIKHRGGIPVEGALSLMQADPEVQGPKLFTTYCASCHAHTDAEGKGIAGPTEGDAAPNLYGFASREWITGVLDAEKFASRAYFGATAHGEDMMMGYMSEHIPFLTDEGKTQLGKVIIALSAEAALKSQAELDATAESDGTLETGRGLLSEELDSEDAETTYSCTNCHKFHDVDDEGGAPDLTGYGSEEWLVELIANPEHERFYGGVGNDRMPMFSC